MKISGHRTPSVFDRYNIVSDQDLMEAAEKQQPYFERQSMTEGIGFKRGCVSPAPTRRMPYEAALHYEMGTKKPSGIGWPKNVSY